MGRAYPHTQAVGRHGCLAEITRGTLVQTEILTSAQQANGEFGRFSVALWHRYIAPSIPDHLGIDSRWCTYACSAGQSDYCSHRTTIGGSWFRPLDLSSRFLPCWGSVCLGELPLYNVAQKPDGTYAEACTPTEEIPTDGFGRY